MKLESIEDKSSSTSVAVKADYLIQKMYRHILHDKCEHCKRILSNSDNDKDEEAGNQPAPDYADGNTHNPTGKLGSEYYDTR